MQEGHRVTLAKSEGQVALFHSHLGGWTHSPGRKEEDTPSCYERFIRPRPRYDEMGFAILKDSWETRKCPSFQRDPKEGSGK